ncbi:MAG: phosphatidate cytidylyltransferase [Candidatus Zixiibacteriota bacterium]|jgi:phosphatidate cytidylyltransferase
MLAARVLTAALWLPVHLIVIIWGRPWHFVVYLEAIAAVALLEMFGVLEATGRRPHRFATMIAGGVFLAALAYRPALAAGAAAALTLAVVAIPVFRNDAANAAVDAGASLLAFAYVPAFLAFLVLIRKMAAGVELLLIFFITIWCIDIAAYFVGRAFGKRKLAPSISPGKTVAGAVGGTAAGLAVPVVLTLFVFRETGLGWAGALLAGAVLAAGDMVGDLAESALKRDAGVKDSGGILPGHGGILDRFDAVLYCAPLFFGVLVVLGRVG